MKNSILLKISYFILSLGLFLCAAHLEAQTDLNNDGYPHQIDFSGTHEDFIIPSNPLQNSIEFTLQGGDGNKHGYCDAPGGKGAVVRMTFPVGNGAGELQPGGTVRFVVGESGQRRTGLNSGGAGGGGGTAVLYHHPNASGLNADQEPSLDMADAGSDWVLLGVAGGGGGGRGTTTTVGTCSVGSPSGGKGGRTVESGGTVDNSNGGTNGNGGQGDAYAGGGGGYKSAGTTEFGGKKGGIKGGAGGFSGDSNDRAGGWGYGGGGAGDNGTIAGGGGGGGFSGGAGNKNNGGGGGGSFINDDALAAYQLITGNDQTQNPSSGYIRYAFRSAPGPIVGCKNIQITPPDNISPSDIMDGFGVEPFHSLINLTFVDPGSIIPLSMNFNCTDLGTHLVEIKLTSSSGATDKCTATVTVKPTVEVTCTPFTIFAPVGLNSPFIPALDQVGSVTRDDCSAVTDTWLSQSEFTCDDIGVTDQVTFYALDSGGFITSCTADIGVIDFYDTESISCPANIVTSTDITGCNLSLTSEILPDYSGRCDATLLFQIDYPGAAFPIIGSGEPGTLTFPVGTSSIAYTLTGPDNSSQSCSFTVTINDNEPPVAACKDAIISYDNGLNDYTVLVDDGSTDNCNIAQISLSHNSFGCAEVGDNEVTLTIMDDAGNTNSCTAVITVEDDPAPLTITCPSNIVTMIDPGTCTKLLTSGLAPSWAGTCSDMLTYEITPPASGPFDPLPIPGTGEITSFNFANKTSTVEYTITTYDNQTASCSFTVTVDDDEAPLAACKNATVQVGALVTNIKNLIDDGSSDNCTLASVTTTNLALSCENVGDNELVLTVTDKSGNTSTCTALLTIEDNIAPIMVCQDITVQLDATGNASITATDIDGGSSDLCGINTLEADTHDFTCADLGAHVVVLTATDHNGNAANCNANVTVEDSILPTAQCQNLVVNLDGDGNASIVTSDIDDGSSDNCSIASMELSRYTFGCSSIGTKIVTLTVTDIDDNTATCNAFVFVADPIKPDLVCKDNFIIELDANGEGSYSKADLIESVSDNCSVEPINPALYTVDCSDSDVGSFMETVKVFDPFGNSRSCTAIITVVDHILPEAICQDITLQLDINGNGSVSANEIDNGSNDACGIESNISQDVFDCSDVGSQSIILTISDSNGNASTCSATVTVEDNVAPNIICQDVTLQLDDDGLGAILTSDVDNGSSDACSIASLALDQYDFDCADVGANTVTMTATDNNGNTNTCTATVSVEDNTPPVVLCQDITLNLGSLGTKSFDTEMIQNGPITDACGILDIENQRRILSCNNVGTFTASITARDVNNNSFTCEATVTVEDNRSPDAQCMDYAVLVDLDANGTAILAVEDIDNGSSDACGIASRTLSQYEFDCSDVGSHTVVLTITDIYDNSSTCSTTVEVEDNVVPEAVCQDITVQLDVTGQASIMVDDIDGNSLDACGLSAATLSQSTFDCDDVGLQSVVLTVSDNNGNSSNCTASVLVEDNVAPMAVCQTIDIHLDETGNASITADAIDGGSSDACAFSLSATPLDFTSADVGDNTVTLTATDVSGNNSSCLATVNILKRPTTLTYMGDLSVQYSDEVSLSAELIDDLTGLGIEGMTVTFTIGTQSTTAETDVNGIAATSMIITQAPTVLGHSYTVVANFDGTPIYDAASDAPDFSILQEDARAFFTGAMFVSTGGSNSDEATVLLSATIQDITVVNPPDADWDPNAGMIMNAAVNFINRDDGSIINPTPIPVSPIDATTGTVIFNWAVDIGNNDAENFRIGIEVVNYYIRNSAVDDATVTVYKPLNDFATGGGYIILTENSEGVIAGDAGTKSNFGFNIKFNPAGTNLKGRVRVLVRRMESDGTLHTYQIKGNQMQSLAVDPDGQSAVFTGKANVQDVTDPDNPISLGGNRIFQIEMEDNGEPGSTDLISFSLYANNGTLWYSSNWSGIESTMQLLDGGNLVIHTGGNGGLIAPIDNTDQAVDGSLQLENIDGDNYQLKAFPNPFASKTNIQIALPEAGRVKLDIFDLSGQKVAHLGSENLDKGEHQFQWDGNNANGQQLPPGIYLLRLEVNDKRLHEKLSLVR